MKIPLKCPFYLSLGGTLLTLPPPWTQFSISCMTVVYLHDIWYTTMLAKQLNYFLHFFFFLFCSVSNTMGGPHGNRMNTTGETTVSAQDDSDEQQEVIEVQILPQVHNFSQLKDFGNFRFSL